MIRHIVLFKVKPGVSDEDKAALVDMLKGLKDKIDLVKELEIGEDVGCKENSCDIGLNSTFDDMESLEAYAVHPDHVLVVKRIKELCLSTVKIDYTIAEK